MTFNKTLLLPVYQGCGKEVYRAKLSKVFEGKSFGQVIHKNSCIPQQQKSVTFVLRSQVANVVFAKYNCTLFAVEIVDRKVPFYRKLMRNECQW